MVHEMCKAGLAVLAWTGVGAFLGALGGFGFGLLFGLVDGMIQGSWWRLFQDGVYLTLCGAAVGALLGAFGRVMDEHVFVGPSSPWADYPAEETPITRPTRIVSVAETGSRELPTNGRLVAPSYLKAE